MTVRNLCSAIVWLLAMTITTTKVSAFVRPSIATRSVGQHHLAPLAAMERTYIMIKPDGVQRGLVGNIIGRFETKGYKLVAMKTRMASKEILELHYQDLVEKPFFPKLRDYMLSGPVVCMIWEGDQAVSTGRKMLGATNPLESAPGTIRGDFCIQVGRNICHGSDSVDNANREIGLWFQESELLEWDSHSHDWIYE